MIHWQTIDGAIRDATGRAFSSRWRRSLGSNGFNESHCIGNDRQRYFVKLCRADRRETLAAEAAGLEELAPALDIRVPNVIAHGVAGDKAFLALEFIALYAPDAGAMAALGEALADMHGVVATQYGWPLDNTLGGTTQRNAWHPRWMEFWRENRLARMLDKLAPSQPRLCREGNSLLPLLDKLLGDHVPEASLLHGDLWGGNMGMDGAGSPVLFDPAVYYGDRETDLAMAELFGGFSPVFMEAYWTCWPMSPGYRELRRPLYQLYHLLNHALMFGGRYVHGSRQLIQQLRARLA